MARARWRELPLSIVTAAAHVPTVAMLTIAGCLAKDGGDEPPCPSGSEPAGELAWSKADDGIGLGAVRSFTRLAALPNGDVAAVAALENEEGEPYDVVVAVFHADGSLHWNEVHDGLAGLSDRALSVTADDDGVVHVLVSEAVSETPWEWEPGVSFVLVDARLVHLAYLPNGGAPASRWEWERPPAEPPESFTPVGTIGVADDDLVVVGWADSMQPELRTFDSGGAERGAAELFLPPDTTIQLGAIDPGGRVLLAGSTARNGPDDDGWLAAYDLAGGLVWEAVLEGDNVETVRLSPRPDGGVVAYWGSEAGIPGAPSQLGRFDVDGALLWSKEIDVPDADGYAGRLTSMCDGDFTAVLATGSELLVSRFDENGNVRWQATYDAGADDRVTVQDIVALAGGDLVVAAAGADLDSAFHPWLGLFRAGAG
jgi:hypothetical protein